MIDIAEALKNYILQNNPNRKLPIGTLKIVEDKAEKVSESMYKLEFLVTFSGVYGNNVLKTQSVQQSHETIQPHIMMRPQVYAGESLLNMDEIVKSDQYGSMTKFSLDKSKGINQSHSLRLPKEVLKQYLGDQEFVRCKEQKGLISNDFMMLCSRDVQNKEMLLMPKETHNILLNMNNSAKKFLEYYNEGYDLDIVSVNPGTFIIKGIPQELRRPGDNILFYSNNQAYIKMIRFRSQQ